MNTERENEFPYCDDAGPFKLVTEGHYWKKVRPEDLLASQNHPQPESSVATLACTEGNSILKRCNLPDDELMAKCAEWISSLCKTGGRSWTLRVPVDFERDPDILFTELIRRFKVLHNHQADVHERDARKAEGSDTAGSQKPPGK